MYNTADLGMHPSIVPSPNNGHHLLKFMQFLTVSIQLAELGRHVSVALNHTAMQTVLTKLQPKLSHLMDNISMTECELYSGGSVLYWGAGLSRHLRSWCFSSLFLNEPSPTILRSRVPHTLQLVFRSSLGLLTEDPQLSVDLLQLQLEVSSFGVMNDTHGIGGAAEGQDGGGGGAGPGVGAGLGEALLAEAGATGLIGALLLGAVLLTLVAALAGWMCSRPAEPENGSDHSDRSPASTDTDEPDQEE